MISTESTNIIQIIKVIQRWIKGLSQKTLKSITFTFVSQFSANFEIKFLIV